MKASNDRFPPRTLGGPIYVGNCEPMEAIEMKREWAREILAALSMRESDTNEEDAEDAFARSGIRSGELIGEGAIESVERAEEL